MEFVKIKHEEMKNFEIKFFFLGLMRNVFTLLCQLFVELCSIFC